MKNHSNVKCNIVLLFYRPIMMGNPRFVGLAVDDEHKLAFSSPGL